MNTKRNPDLITPEGAIRGNMYIRKHVNNDPENDDTQSEGNQKKVQEAGSSDEEKAGAQIDDMFAKLKSQTSRYFLEQNITIKCLRCREFGHMARECPNDRTRLNCILCGKDTHDSFECTEKLCFKCNRLGHKASDCKEKNVIRCMACGQVGHEQ